MAAVVTLLLAGCGDFRQRAEEVEGRLADAEARADQALSAAAENKADIRELRGLLASLEARLDELVNRTSAEDAPTKEEPLGGAE
jgi:hypothetical protein